MRDQFLVEAERSRELEENDEMQRPHTVHALADRAELARWAEHAVELAEKQKHMDSC